MEPLQTKKKLTSIGKVICVLTLLLFDTGCFGEKEINELAIVTAVGIDPGKQPGDVLLTAQIIRPADARGQTGAPSGGTGEPVYSIQAEGSSFFQAIRNLARFSSRRVYWAQNYIIVINDMYAREGIQEMIDFFTRNHELRMNTWVAVTPDKAGQVVSTITGLEVVPGSSLDKLFRYNELVGEASRSNMMRLQENYLSDTTEAVLAKLQLRKRGISNKKPEQFGSLNQVELSGLAVFKKDKMLGYLSTDQSRAALFFLEHVQSGMVVIPCDDNPKGRVSLEYRDHLFKVKPGYQEGNPRFQVSLTTDAHMVENGCTHSFSDMRTELENSMAEHLKSTIQAVVEKSQKEYKVDFLKLGEIFENHYPYEWKQLASEWDKKYPQAEVTIQVKANILSPELMVRPTKSSKEET